MRKQVKKNDKPIQDVLKDFLKQNKITPGYYNSKIQNIWAHKMGSTINNYTRKVHFSKGKVYLKIDSAPLKQELLMGKEKLIKILNEELGSELVKDIFIN